MRQNVPQVCDDRNVVVKTFTFVLATSHHADVSTYIAPPFIQNVCFESHEQGFEAQTCHHKHLVYIKPLTSSEVGLSQDGEGRRHQEETK